MYQENVAPQLVQKIGKEREFVPTSPMPSLPALNEAFTKEISRNRELAYDIKDRLRQIINLPQLPTAVNGSDKPVISDFVSAMSKELEFLRETNEFLGSALSHLKELI